MPEIVVAVLLNRLKPSITFVMDLMCRWSCSIRLFTPLADHWTWGRALRFADGPDEVHLQTIARLEIRRMQETSGAAAYLTKPERHTN
ncbi:hypothetical protein R69746_06389 [Paraburkholderia aspalathi]|nr:hypothetical protein R69746_06389 [Paraburkholderia aspalathi]CAE6854487.1 hypothetical protein R75465_07342 [Paraburkholderia aspalathi]